MNLLRLLPSVRFDLLISCCALQTECKHVAAMLLPCCLPFWKWMKCNSGILMPTIQQYKNTTFTKSNTSTVVLLHALESFGGVGGAGCSKLACYNRITFKPSSEGGMWPPMRQGNEKLLRLQILSPHGKHLSIYNCI